LNVPVWVTVLPHVNAALNGTALVLLLTGLGLIRRGKKEAHMWSMLCAFATSIAFLACYLTYHWALGAYTGSSSRHFPGTGLVRGLYLTILIPHVILAFFVPVFAITMIVFAWRKRWNSHCRLAKVAFPIWVYVSATGVIIYLMLYHMPIGDIPIGQGG